MHDKPVHGHDNTPLFLLRVLPDRHGHIGQEAHGMLSGVVIPFRTSLGRQHEGTKSRRQNKTARKNATGTGI